MRRLLYAICLLAAGPATAELTFLGSYHWTVEDPRFGGFSAIEVTNDGGRFTALSDRGFISTGRIDRKDGIIADVHLESFSGLVSADNTELGRADLDSEGLAIGVQGAVFASFEWKHGIRQLDGNVMGRLQRSPDFRKLQPNSSLEALAVDKEGIIYAMPERSGRQNWPFPVWRLKQGNWDVAFELPRRGPFLITGADIGPDGMLYVLERDFVLVGFRTRIRRFALDGGGEETLLETDIRTHDNLEGLSVWDDGIGLRLTLISDDNYRSWQRTEIVEYRLTDK